MELWIRSQDKTTLIRSYEIYIVENSQGIYCIRAKRTSHILGVYNTIERALEVLDEIQCFLNGSITKDIYVNGDYCGSWKTQKTEIVYEMPKE